MGKRQFRKNRFRPDEGLAINNRPFANDLSNRPRLKVLIYVIGTALFGASLVFIAIHTARNWDAVTVVRVGTPEWLAASIGLYAISHISTGLSWPIVIRQLGERIALVQGLRIGLISQAGKYLPGNIAHYLGRGGLANTAGISIRASSASVAVEFTSALAAALLLVSVILIIDPRQLDFVPQLGTGTAILVVSIVAGMIGLAAWSVKQGHGPMLFVGPTACLAISFALSGLSFYALALSLGYRELLIPSAIGAFAIAWAGGFIVPGAPAGLGVREAILVALLGPAIGPGPILACVLIHRLMTACIDGIAAIFGYVWFVSATFSKE